MVTIDIVGAEQLARAWEQAPEIVREELTAATYEAELLLQREAQENTPTAFGTARQSILAQEPEVASDNVIGMVGSALNYITPLELGSKPHFPPVAALEDWVRLKLAPPADEVRNVAYLVARKIAAKGTQPHRMFGKALE